MYQRIFGAVWSRKLIKVSQAESENAKKEEALLVHFPYLELSKLERVEKTRNTLTKVQSLRRFFGVSSLFNLKEVRKFSPAFRQSTNNEISHESLISHILGRIIYKWKMKVYRTWGALCWPSAYPQHYVL